MGGYILATLALFIPSVIRDLVYDMIAAVRHRLMGTRDECRSGNNGNNAVDLSHRFIT